MKIAILTEYFPNRLQSSTGGVEVSSYYLSRELSLNHDITVYTSFPKGLERTSTEGNVKINRIGPEHKYSNKGDIIKRIHLIISYFLALLKSDVDTFICYSVLTYIPGFFAAKLKRKKCIVIIHEFWFSSWIEYKGLITGIFGDIHDWIIYRLNWDLVITRTNITAEKIKRHFHKKRIEKIVDGVNFTELDSSNTKKEKPTVVFVSRLVKHKRAEDLIKAIALLKQKIPDIECKIIGTGPEQARLKNLVKSKGLEENIEFLGYVQSHSDVLKIISQSHVFVFPSIREGFGIVLVEAMFCGTPFVASDMSVFREVSDNGKGGLFFEPRNPIDLSQQIMKLLNDPQLLKFKQIEGKEQAKQYEWNNVSKKFENVLKKIF